MLTKQEVASDLKMLQEDVYNHMMNHMTVQVPKSAAEEKVKTIYGKRDVLFNNMVSLNQRLDTYLNNNSLTPADTSQIVKLAGEVRRTVMDLAELEGELRQEQHITLIQFNELKAAILRELSPEQQQKVIARLTDALVP